ncbi:hypothetical protein D3C86_1784000 [compost metagenome]
MAFLVGQEGLEQVLGDIVAKLFAELAARLVGGAGVIFAGKVGFQHFLDGLADSKRRNALQVRMAFKEDDTLDQPVGVMHLFDGFSAFLGCKLLIAPVIQQAEMHPILVDGAEFEKEGFVKPLDDLCFAFHDVLHSVAA